MNFNILKTVSSASKLAARQRTPRLVQRRNVTYPPDERGGIRPNPKPFYAEWFGDMSMWPLLVVTGGAVAGWVWWLGYAAEESKNLKEATHDEQSKAELSSSTQSKKYN